jgi:hypothetical protein
VDPPRSIPATVEFSENQPPISSIAEAEIAALLVAVAVTFAPVICTAETVAGPKFPAPTPAPLPPLAVTFPPVIVRLSTAAPAPNPAPMPAA